MFGAASFALRPAKTLALLSIILATMFTSAPFAGADSGTYTGRLCIPEYVAVPEIDKYGQWGVTYRLEFECPSDTWVIGLNFEADDSAAAEHLLAYLSSGVEKLLLSTSDTDDDLAHGLRDEGLLQVQAAAELAQSGIEAQPWNADQEPWVAEVTAQIAEAVTLLSEASDTVSDDVHSEALAAATELLMEAVIAIQDHQLPRT